ncbi:hypothetical protein [Rhodanobacter sp. C06]|uniref:hypothetical protein n=1 Tax=Rhodanobacter sp. C06 TaxID=1945854 RepID=UPI001115A8BC|nr:hypothetical protein [Rhodanobacter sp. C06]
MTSTALISCENCWFNALQHDSVGTSFGYCSQFKKLLRRPYETTCGQLMRKDIDAERNITLRDFHLSKFPKDKISAIRDVNAENWSMPKSIYISSNIDSVLADQVGRQLVAPESNKIGAIAALKRIKSVRSEFAFVIFGRSYIYTCNSRGGAWTSGINILRWVKKSLVFKPPLSLTDIRFPAGNTYERQENLVHWSLMISKLRYISDLGFYARRQGDEAGLLEEILESASEEVEGIDSVRLEKWIRQIGFKKMDRAMPPQRMKEIIESLSDDFGI